MKITFIQTSNKRRELQLPIGIASIAAMLEKNDFNDIDVFDMNFFNKPEKELEGYLKMRKPDIIGISAMTANIKSAYKTAEICKKNSNAIICIGGPHVSVVPQEAASHSAIDFVIIGEGELTMLELLQVIKQNKNPKKVNGLAFKSNNKIVFTKPREFIKNLDSLPMPAYHYLDMKRYTTAINGVGSVKKLPWSVIMTSRGCPYKCVFCSRFLGNKIRFRSVENVIEEIRYQVKNYKIKELWFQDDNFTLDKERAIKIADTIRDEFDIIFRFPNGVRIDRLDKEMMKHFVDAGCYSVSFGIESGSQKILNNVKKGITIEQIKKTVNMVASFGIHTMGFFILGLPGETRKTALETIKLAKELPLSDASFYIATPYPGTEMFGAMDSHPDWELMDHDDFKPLSCSKYLTPEEVVELTKLAMIKFYLRPQIIMKKLKNLISPKQAHIALKLMSKWF